MSSYDEKWVDWERTKDCQCVVSDFLWRLFDIGLITKRPKMFDAEGFYIGYLP